MRFNRKPMLVLILLVLTGLTLPTCKKLDEDGGYYDEATKTYKYVNITKKGVQPSGLKVTSPVAGRVQQIYGNVTRIGDDAKSIWLRIADRRPYMILAERLSGGNRNDKDKELRIQLKYVSPLGSVSRNGAFKEKWSDYVKSSLSQQMLNKQILVEIDYAEQARQLWGTCYLVLETANGAQARNINLWMIQQGLSFYFIDQGKALDDTAFRAAQESARKNNIGIWKYR